jgi:hypothetical protein
VARITVERKEYFCVTLLRPSELAEASEVGSLSKGGLPKGTVLYHREQCDITIDDASTLLLRPRNDKSDDKENIRNV